MSNGLMPSPCAGTRQPMLACAALAMVCSAWISGCVWPPGELITERSISTAQLGLGNEARENSADERWWRALGDAQLDALIDRALQSSPSLAQAIARMRSAAAQERVVAAGARPGVTLDANEVYQRFSENYIFPPPYGGGTYWLGQVGPNLRWNLDFWGRQAELIHAATAREGAALLDHAAARLALESAIVQAYVDLDRAYAFQDIADRAAAQREQLLKLTQGRVSSGLDTQIELKLAQAALPQARAQRLQAIQQRELAAHRLAELTAQGAGVYAGIGRPSLSRDALSIPKTLPMDLLARRPDILASLVRIDAAHAEQAAAHAAFYPDISLTAFAGVQAIGLDTLLKSSSAIFGAGPELHVPIFDAQRLRANYTSRTAEVDAAIADHNAVVLRAVREAADQLALVASYDAQIDEARQSLSASEDAFRISQERYGAGLGTQLTVLNAESQVLAARRDLKFAEANSTLARVNLLLACGGNFIPPAWAAKLAARGS